MRTYEPHVQAALKPLQSRDDRDHALCVLGHLETDQREHPSAERAATIRTIATAVRGYDARHFGSAAAIVSAIPDEAAAKPGAAPMIVPPVLAVPTNASVALDRREEPRADLVASMRQRHRVDAPAAGASACSGRVDLLASRDARANAGQSVDLVADMKRRHGIAA
ncbi:MAG: hypothetical protein K0Q54_4737 [Methylobacterium brachiatum]|jgi:hypothetical protein|nr:hypothetical protein [Methylobacterium brachiatum]